MLKSWLSRRRRRNTSIETQEDSSNVEEAENINTIKDKSISIDTEEEDRENGNNMNREDQDYDERDDNEQDDDVNGDEPTSIDMLRDLLSRKSSVEANSYLSQVSLHSSSSETGYNGIITETEKFVERNQEKEMRALCKLKNLLFNYKRQIKDKRGPVLKSNYKEVFPFRIDNPVLDVDKNDDELKQNLESDPGESSKSLSSCSTNINVPSDTLILKDTFLLQCLRARSYSVEEAFCVCLNFHDFRRSAKWSLESIDPFNLIIPLESNVHWILPGYDYNHRRVVVFNPKYMNTVNCTIEQYQKMGQYLVETLVNKDISTQFNGVTFVVDVNGLPYRTVLAGMGIADIKRGTGMWRDAFPCKLKSILILGLNGFTRNIVNVCLKVASKKVQDRVRCLQTYDELKTFIPQENLPLALHGSNESFVWEEKLKDFLPPG